MKPMKKRNAITVAALASLGFGGAATAAVSVNHADSNAAGKGTANGEVTASDVAQKRAKPKVVKVYVDEPAEYSEDVSDSVSDGSSDSSDTDTQGAITPAEPASPTPTTSHGSPRDSSDDSSRDADDDEHAATPGTNIAPPTTTTGGSGSGEHENDEDHNDEDHNDEDHDDEDDEDDDDD